MSSTSNSSQAWGTGSSAGHSAVPKHDSAAWASGQTANVLAPLTSSVCRYSPSSTLNRMPSASPYSRRDSATFGVIGPKPAMKSTFIESVPPGRGKTPISGLGPGDRICQPLRWAAVKTKHLAVPAQAVWELLLGSGRRDWYYRLSSEGSFEPGAKVRWLDTRGETAEESEVLEMSAPLLLKLRTRFLFAPALAAAPAHELTWELSPERDGTLVTLSWTGSGPAVSLLESEGGAILEGLALAADPEARAALERLPEIGPLAIRDLTPELLADYQRFFDQEAFRDYPAWQSCYCMETLWDGSDEEWAPRTAADNRREMSVRVGAGRVAARTLVVRKALQWVPGATD